MIAIRIIKLSLRTGHRVTLVLYCTFLCYVQEYLEMQRQLALQRLQEQEREMAMRFEQQKQLTHMRQMQTYGYPQVRRGRLG